MKLVSESPLGDALAMRRGPHYWVTLCAGGTQRNLSLAALCARVERQPAGVAGLGTAFLGAIGASFQRP